MQPLAVARCREGDCGLTLGIKSFTRASELYPALKDDHARRRAMIVKMAKLAAAMHSAGMAHQDFYLVHVFVLPGDELCLIDLQRMIRSSNLADRWVVKDLGQLLFAVKSHAVRGDIALFIRVYAKARGLKLGALRRLLAAVSVKSSTIAKHDAKRAARLSTGKPMR